MLQDSYLFEMPMHRLVLEKKASRKTEPDLLVVVLCPCKQTNDVAGRMVKGETNARRLD